MPVHGLISVTPPAPRSSGLPKQLSQATGPPGRPGTGRGPITTPGQQAAPRRCTCHPSAPPEVYTGSPGHPGACHTRAIRRGVRGLATVTHGQVGADDQHRCSRRSAAVSGARTSKLVMRVRFPSSALILYCSERFFDILSSLTCRTTAPSCHTRATKASGSMLPFSPSSPSHPLPRRFTVTRGARTTH